MCRARLGRRREHAQPHARAFIDERRIPHLPPCTLSRLLALGQLAEHPGSRAGRELRLLRVLLLRRACMLRAQLREVARARNHLLRFIDQHEVHAQMRRQEILAERIARHGHTHRAQQRIGQLRMQGSFVNQQRPRLGHCLGHRHEMDAQVLWQ
jgi:hypothetical protein